MRRYVLPLVVCAAVGGLVVLLVKSGEERPQPDRPDAKPAREEPEQVSRGTDAPGVPRRDTRTQLDEHRWLSELERTLGREDLSRARYFRQKVCEDLERILEDRKLTENLLTVIREHGLESDDPRRRDVVLPMLRVLEHPEATQMIEEEYYRARTDEERMVLLEAMSHDYHRPEVAAQWAIERALNADTKEQRDRAFEVIERFSRDDDLVVDVGLQIYESTTRPDQRHQVLDAITFRGANVPRVREFVRQKLKSPRPEELPDVVLHIEAWGTERDAAQLEKLADLYPAMGDWLRDRARQVREARRIEEQHRREEEIEKMSPEEREKARAALLEQERRMEQEEEERLRREEEARKAADEAREAEEGAGG